MIAHFSTYKPKKIILTIKCKKFKIGAMLIEQKKLKNITQLFIDR